MGERPSSVRLGPDAQEGLREMISSMGLKGITQGELLKHITGSNGPLGSLYGYPLFPMKANGVAAV